ncbi:MAG: hypothetical protein HKM24_03365, partial [Gammaproteobacteria bacterium]|nr:hypothetical protein [Gammaproteobacteria bacterium]
GSVCEATIISREQIDYFWSNANEISATDWQQRPLIRPCQVSGLVHINDTSYDFFVTADGYGVLWLGNEEQHFFHCANCVEHWESMG